MTAIPADIQKAAAAVYAQLGRGPDTDEQAIAKALMSERLRACQTAIAQPNSQKSPEYDSGYAQARVDIARAISEPTPPATGA